MPWHFNNGYLIVACVLCGSVGVWRRGPRGLLVCQCIVISALLRALYPRDLWGSTHTRGHCQLLRFGLQLRFTLGEKLLRSPPKFSLELLAINQIIVEFSRKMPTLIAQYCFFIYTPCNLIRSRMLHERIYKTVVCSIHSTFSVLFRIHKYKRQRFHLCLNGLVF